MTASEISEAMAYEKIEPFLAARIDYWFKQLLSSIHNVNRPNKNSKVWRPSDFNGPWEGQRNDVNEDLNDQIKNVFSSSN